MDLPTQVIATVGATFISVVALAVDDGRHPILDQVMIVSLLFSWLALFMTVD